MTKPQLGRGDWTTESPRKGDWSQTFSSVQFWPLDPRAEEIKIIDIAHSLSNQCRFAGHCRTFYSVGEHSVRASWLVGELEPKWALCALLHDASEAYCVDVPRPLKRNLVGYKEIEDKIWAQIAIAFDLPVELPDVVKRADEILLMTEKRDIMGPAPAPWGLAQGVQVDPLPEVIRPWSPEVAKSRFLARFTELTGIEP